MSRALPPEAAPANATPAPLVLVVDDDSSLRKALLRLLAAAGLEGRGYASAGDVLLEPLPERAGCMLLDLSMPGPSGLELQAALQRRGEELPIIFLTGHGDVHDGVRAMKGGAIDFITKPVDRQTLLDAVQRALLAGAARAAVRAEEAQLRQRFATLTAREREIFDQVAAGRLNKQIAFDLGLAERTVKAERAEVMAKLGIASAAEFGQLAERIRHLPWHRAAG
jgi:FixJ family two-component response regulator